MNFSAILLCLLTLAQNPYTASQTYTADNGACKQLDKEVYAITDGACHISSNKLNCLSPEFDDIITKPRFINLVLACNTEILNSLHHSLPTMIKIGVTQRDILGCNNPEKNDTPTSKKICHDLQQQIDRNVELLITKQPHDTKPQRKRFSRTSNR